MPSPSLSEPFVCFPLPSDPVGQGLYKEDPVAC